MTPLESAMSRPKAYSADSILLDKSERRLTMFHRGREVASYEVALGKNPIGPKSRRGDGRTPEGPSAGGSDVQDRSAASAATAANRRAR